MAATMREVAEAAGVSIATVSFVVNDSKRVAPATRRRIEHAMAELGFRPNKVARALASRRTQILALVYPALEHPMATAMDFLISASRAATAADHHLVVWLVSYDGRELAALVGQQLVDGVLLMEVQLDDPRVTVLQELRIPFAVIGRTRDVAGLSYVDIDFDRTMQLAMDHLAELGHTRIAFINGSQDDPGFASYGPWVRSEMAYGNLAAERGIDPVVLRCRQGVLAGREAAAELIRTAPDTTAVIMAVETAAAGLVVELGRLGRSVPHDISVISINGMRDIAASCNPPLTVVTAPGTELGRLGVEALLSQLDGAAPLAPELRTGELTIGESTGPVRPDATTRKFRLDRGATAAETSAG
jgi:DNA-binding LacI/PurR family transcriptional regulator